MNTPPVGSSAAIDSRTAGHSLVLVNPACLERAGITVDDLTSLCVSVNLEAEVHLMATRLGPRDGEALLASRPARLIIAGGDGTLHHVVNVLLAQKTASPLPPIGLLPLGTANDFARSLGLPADLRAALQTIAAGKARPVDVGCVNSRYFLNVAHIGNLAESSRQVWPWLKRGLKGRAYGLVVATTAWRIKPFTVMWTDGDGPQAVEALHLAIANGRYFGGGVPIDQQATLDDGLLDVAVISTWKRFIPPKVRRLRATEISVGLSESPPMSLDGEPFESAAHLSFRVLPGAIAVFTPAAGGGFA